MILHLFGSTNRDCSICKFFNMNNTKDEDGNDDHDNIIVWRVLESK